MGAIKAVVCRRGHAMVDPNLYYRGNGQRECKACKELGRAAKKKERDAEPRERKKRVVVRPVARHKRKPTIKQQILRRGGA